MSDSSVPSWSESSASWRALAHEYARLEVGLRVLIDPVAAHVCPACTRLCCRVHYCRETARNPWYRLVNEVAGNFPIPEDWQTRREAFGLGPGGCAIRAGRYVFCYSYNCPAIERLVRAWGISDEFQEISDLLRIVNRLPAGRLLHEIRDAGDFTGDDRLHLERTLAESGERLHRLRGPVQAAIERTELTSHGPPAP